MTVNTALVTKAIILDGLRNLGVLPGAQLLVHSSLSSFGRVDGGASAVIDTLVEAVNPGGTVLVPTLTGSEGLSPHNPPRFDPQNTPCWTGLIPETFRKRPEAIRSQHPTHSVAAIGVDAVSLTRDHIDSLTPCDELSPYGKLAELETAYMLLIGVDHTSNTTLHHVEEIAGVEYHMQTRPTKAVILMESGEVHRQIFLHRYGQERNFNVIDSLLEERGVQRRAKIGASIVRLAHIKSMAALALSCVRVNRRFLCMETLNERFNREV